jgi:hypothetical protein
VAVKLFTEQRGPLQGVSLASIVRTAYGPEAEFREDPDGNVPGLIVRPSRDVSGADAYDQLDVIVEMHEE